MRLRPSILSWSRVRFALAHSRLHTGSAERDRGERAVKRRSASWCTTNGYAHPHALWSRPSWVAAHQGDPNVRLVEVDVDTAAYETGHIPGAVGWNWRVDLQRHPERDIPTEAEWEALLSRSGIGNDDLVVLYGDNNNWFAAFAYWLFKFYGHDDVCLMNGGREKWIDEGRELTTGRPGRSRRRRYQARGAESGAARLPRRCRRRSSVAPTWRWSTCARRRSTPASCLPRRTCRRRARSAAGTSPAPQNVPWATAVAEDGTFKSADELRAIYGGKGDHRRTRRPSPTAASASAAPTPGSC